MRATDFEYRHQTLVHQFIVGAAILTYFVDREDIVWRYVKDSEAPHVWERAVFVVATLLIAVGAAMCTQARASRDAESESHTARYRSLSRRLYAGEVCYAVGLGSLVPLPGLVILAGGEVLRVYRLMQRDKNSAGQREPPVGERPADERPLKTVAAAIGDAQPKWGRAFRKEAVKWGILVTMMVFTITLVDRHADIGVGASFLVGLLLNLQSSGDPSNSRASS